ncbi:MAG: DUF370 domain-containing protein [Oscillospiraceae bacterium]|nr:DUF370 domain-containing protein [Oscillospiraceae bacterium]
MYLHLGQSVVVALSDIIGIFDLDNTSSSHITRAFLKRQEQEKRVVNISDDLPKSFVLCQKKGKAPVLYLSQLSSATLKGRAEEQLLE